MFPSSRRDFLKQTALAATAVAVAPHSAIAVNKPGDPPSKNVPWYRRTLRWGQTNITEIDPERYDIAWWRQYWKRTETQGVIVNAGGIVAYYPTKIPLHHQAEYLNGRDLFGELCRAAHEDGLMVFARMDSNRAHEDLYRAHPDWFARRSNGQPYKADDLFVTCINSPYYEEQIPAILHEIIETYHPEGFTDNSWSGLGRNSPCFCDNCKKHFQERTGHAIPEEKNWNDPIYREWVRWNYERRLEIWDLNNRITQTAGGRDCIWVGMNGGSIAGQAQSFRDYRQICQRAEMIMLDYQARGDGDGFQQNGEAGKLIHGLLGWDKLIPESMALYQMGKPLFRFASKPEPEARLWMLDGIAGGLQPWWHQVSAYHEDRRRYKIPEPILQWHRANESYLYNRRPLATVGVVWSQQNLDFYGRDDGGVLVELPWRGMTQALVRARIPFLPVHADDLERDAANFSALVLPNLAAMSDSQLTAVRRFVEKGGGLLATGQSSRFNESGETRPDFALADLFGAHISQNDPVDDESRRRRWATETVHTYLRLSPELRARVDGPHIKGEPPASGSVIRCCKDLMKPTFSLTAECSTRFGWMRAQKSADIYPRVANFSSRESMDARTEDRHSRIDFERAAKQGQGGVPARGSGPPLCAGQSSRPRQSAGEPRSLDCRRQPAIGGGGAWIDGLSSLQPARPHDSSRDESHQPRRVAPARG